MNMIEIRITIYIKVIYMPNAIMIVIKKTEIMTYLRKSKDIKSLKDQELHKSRLTINIILKR